MVPPQLRRWVHDQTLAVAVDGPSGAGKSTIGRALAARLGCRYLDTGVMYRAVTWQALRSKASLTDEKLLGDIAEKMNFNLTSRRGDELAVDGVVSGALLHTALIDEHVSRVSAHPSVRGVLVRRQRRLAEDGCIVMVGRDIGTEVLPEAPLKLWITASARERARRRSLERRESAKGAPQADATFDEILKDIEARDVQDKNRTASPSRPAHDARLMDTDHLSPDEVVDKIVDLLNEIRLRAGHPLGVSL